MQTNNPQYSVCSTPVHAAFKALLLIGGMLFASVAFGQEICNNAIDDDGDGLIDLNDDECVCTGFGNTANVSSLIPNSSFEDRSCCPNGYSDLGCADTWIQASNPTSDYWNMCGAAGSNFDGGTVLPPPDGQGFVGFINMSGWQEYVGACLTQTMTAGDNYELNFWFGHTNNSPPIELTFYGTPNCGDIPFNSNDCPMGLGSFVTLGSITTGGGSGWVQETFNFTPNVNINAIVIGGACGSGGARTYYYLDDLSLNSTDLWEVLSVTQTGLYCEDNIVLEASSDSVGGTWQWYKDGVAIMGQTGSTYNVPAGTSGLGNYTIVYSMNGQCEAENIEVVQPDLPTASFVTSNVCFPEPVQFSDASSVASGSIVNYAWDFGDGNSSALSNPAHTYQSDGTYTVGLTITTDISCTETFQTDVTIHPKPEADFDAVAGCLGDPTTFTDLSQINTPGSIVQYEWQFGDGSNSSLQNPSNFYAAESQYLIELITTSDSGCTDTATATIDVYPSPDVDVSAQAQCALDDVNFLNNSSISSGSIDQYLWEFGDNSSSGLASPTHAYSDPGNYNVTFEAISDRGCVSDTTFQLESYPNPVASFTATDVCAYSETVFSDNSSVTVPGNITAVSFDLGDGNVLQSVPTSHQYGSPGVYTVELIVATQHGCDDTTEVTINVFDIPEADMGFSSVCEDDSVLFTDLSVIDAGNIDAWFWDFGNGVTSSEQAPPHQNYAADGFYPVTLIVSSGSGCSDTITDQIEIFPVPVADFTFDSVCFPLFVQFTDLSEPNGSYDISSWQWTFNDSAGQTSSLQNPLMDFGAPGTYQAELLISNGPGCKSTVTKGDAVVHPKPSADFPSGLAVCLEDTVFLTDQSTIVPVTNDVIDSWTWDLDDSNLLTTQNGYHIYGSPDLYNVTLSIETNNGCTDDVTKLVEIYPLPFVDFTSSPQEGCQPLRVQFLDGSTISDPYSIASWEWTLGPDSSTAYGPNPVMVYDPELETLQIANYNIGLTVTSANGCVADIFRPNYITVYPKPDAFFSVDEDVKDIVDPLFEFTDLSSENVVDWEWSFGDGSYSTDQHPVHLYGDTGNYPITLIVETGYGCLDTAGFRVKVEPVFTFYVPNSFTPDANGVNDEFFGTGEGYVTYQMWIYDRWGEEIFYSESDELHWNGTYRGEQVQQGTYVYRFYLIDWRGHDHEYKGIVTLHR